MAFLCVLTAVPMNYFLWGQFKVHLVWLPDSFKNAYLIIKNAEEIYFNKYQGVFNTMFIHSFF